MSAHSRAARPPRTAPQLLEQLAPNQPRPKIVMSWGLGTDSTAALLYLINTPAARDWELADLCVITAMVGDEWTQTGIDASECVLPILRAHGIRFIQLGRHQRRVTRAGIGIRVLEDSRSPATLHFSGPELYRLSDEMIAAGTIPQTGGARLCSVHAKGQVIDPVIAAITGGAPYRHLIGFEATEGVRALKDTSYNTATRTGEYPLIDWGWDRQAAQTYLLDITGRTWTKSACVFCPYSLATAAGRAATFEKYRAHPAAGARMLWLEHLALALNPRQGLIAGKRAVDHVIAAGLDEVLTQFRTALEASEHAVYELRRTVKPPAPGKKRIRWRAVHALHHGSRAAMLARLNDLPGTTVVGDDGITRRMQDSGGDVDTEHYYVAAPAGVETKKRPGFEALWLSTQQLELPLLS